MNIHIDLITASTTETALLGLCVFIAGIVRGCIGFGFSALVVASGSLFIHPALIVPMLVLLELAASLHMLPGVWRDTAWRLLLFMSLGVMVTTPVGVYVLSIAPQQTLRLILSLSILVMAVVLANGYAYRGALNRPVLIGVGSISGLFNGMAGIGGMPVAIFLASAKLSVNRIRASMVVFLFMTEIVFLFSGIVGGVYSKMIVASFGAALLPMVVGIALGARLYGRLDDVVLRRFILVVLVLLAVVGVARAL
jgi:uncharacterized membrane protein YfcA